MPIVECVPNFSEGHDEQVIRGIVSAIASVKGVRLLHTDTGASANRTVVTFIGTPDSVGEAAFCGIKRAAELIDMRRHAGNHPRMGATDVCPFIPVQDVSMATVNQIALQVAERVGHELHIPVFLYEQSATSPERRDLANIRRGEYEGMAEKLRQPGWQPDFGPAQFNERSGVTAIGAREFLLAYNINLATSDTNIAKDIAAELRESGRIVRKESSGSLYLDGEIQRHGQDTFYCGSCDFTASNIESVAEHTSAEHSYDLLHLLDSHGVDRNNIAGTPVLKPGRFQHVKAIGWYVDEYVCAQISTNVTNYRVTPLHAVFESAKSEARKRGTRVTGSEIVGLIPAEALEQTGEYYLKQQGLSTNADVKLKIRTAVDSLGLSDKTPFKVEEKVLGFPGVDLKL